MPNSTNKLYIENMLSQRCKNIVESVLQQLGLDGKLCVLGEVDLAHKISSDQRNQLRIILSKIGFKLVDEEKTLLISRIIDLIREKYLHLDKRPKVNFSVYITENFTQDYNYLAYLFNRIKGITIENYIISFKIERAKEFLVYDDCNLTEISYKLEYSSVAHLSTQFKKVTGMTPSKFKGLNSSGSVHSVHRRL